MYIGHASVEAVKQRLLAREAWVQFQGNTQGLTMDKVALLFPPPILIPPVLHISASSGADTEGTSEVTVARDSVSPHCYNCVSTHVRTDTCIYRVCPKSHEIYIF